MIARFFHLAQSLRPTGGSRSGTAKLFDAGFPAGDLDRLSLKWWVVYLGGHYLRRRSWQSHFGLYKPNLTQHAAATRLSCFAGSRWCDNRFNYSDGLGRLAFDDGLALNGNRLNDDLYGERHRRLLWCWCAAQIGWDLDD